LGFFEVTLWSFLFFWICIYIGIITIYSCFSISPIWFLTLIGDKTKCCNAWGF